MSTAGRCRGFFCGRCVLRQTNFFSGRLGLSVVIAVLVLCLEFHCANTQLSGKCDRKDAADEPKSADVAAAEAISSARLWAMEGGSPYSRSGSSGCVASLTTVSAAVEVIASLAHVVVNQTYVNDGTVDIADASITLSVPVDSVLTYFEVSIGERSLIGKVRGRKASQSSTDSTSTSAAPPVGTGSCPTDAALGVPAASPGALYVPIGRVAVREKVMARVEYVQEVFAKPRPGLPPSVRWTLTAPSVVRRRPPAASDWPSPSLHGAASPTTAAETSLHILVRIESERTPAVEIASPIIGVTLKKQAPAVLNDVKLTSAFAYTVTSKTLSDVTLEISYPSDEQHPPDPFFAPEVVLERHPVTGTLAAVVALPPTIVADSATVQAAQADFEVVLILDRSPSMRGVRLGRARSSTRIWLQSLPREVRFNLLGFGTSPLGGQDLLFTEGSLHLTEERFLAAVERIAAPQGERAASSWSSAPADASSQEGPVSTSVARALEAVLSGLPRGDGVQLRVIVITDRQPPESEEALQLVAARCSVDCQVFALGLGWGASVTFVESLARAGRGTAQFVAERGGTSALEKALVSQLVEALQPAVWGVSVEVPWLPVANSLAMGGVVRLELDKSPTAEPLTEADADHRVSMFVAQGGIAEFTMAVSQPPLVSSGGRILALAFLGAAEIPLEAFVIVRGQVAGRAVVANVSIGRQRNGSSVHTLSAFRLVRRLYPQTLAAEPVGAQAWKARALGLAYSVETQESVWVAATASEMEQGSQVPVRCGLAETAREPASSDGHAASRGLGTSTEASRVTLSVRHPFNPETSKSSKESGPSAARLASRLSVVNFDTFGSSLSLRQLHAPQARPSASIPRGAYGPPDLPDARSSTKERAQTSSDVFTSSLPLRGKVRISSAGSLSVMDCTHLGASLSLGSLRKDVLMHTRLDPSSQATTQEPLRIPDAPFKSTRNAAAVATKPLALAGETKPKAAPAKDSSKSKAKAASDGRAGGEDKRSSFGVSDLASQISVLDFVHFGSSLSLRKTSVAVDDSAFDRYARGGLLRGGALSALDSLYLGSGLGELPGHGERDRPSGGGGAKTTLAVRSFARLGSSVLAVPLVANKLSAFDFQHIGAALSLRSSSAAPRKVGGTHSHGGAQKRGRGLDPRGMYDDEFGSMTDRGRGANDVWDVGIGEYRDDARGTSLSATSWIALRVVGGLLTPALAVWRVGPSCQPAREVLVINFQATGVDVVPSLSFYNAFGALPSDTSGVDKSTAALVGELKPKFSSTNNRRRRGTHAGHREVRLKVSLSARCEFSIHEASDSSRKKPPEREWAPYGSEDSGLGDILLGPIALPAGSAKDIAHEDDYEVWGAMSPAADSLALEHAGASGSSASSTEPQLRDDRSGGGAAETMRRALDLRRVAAKLGGAPLNGADPLDARVDAASTASSRSFGDYAGDDSSTSARFRALVTAQRFDGAFELEHADSTFPQSALRRVDALTAAWRLQNAAETDANLTRVAAHTAVAVAMLGFEHGSLRGSWALLAEKAERWLLESGASATAACGVPRECVAAADLVVARWEGVAAAAGLGGGGAGGYSNPFGAGGGVWR